MGAISPEPMVVAYVFPMPEFMLTRFKSNHEDFVPILGLQQIILGKTSVLCSTVYVGYLLPSCPDRLELAVAQITTGARS